MKAPPFIIGVWQQPWSSVPKWESRGVTTLYGHDTESNRFTKAQWEDNVGRMGMNFITVPGADVAAESKQVGRIGFNQLDEPDGSSHRDLAGNTLMDLNATYARVRAASDLPVFANFQGSAFDNPAYDGRKHRTDINADRPYWHNAADGGYFAQADVIGMDYHLWTTGRPGAFSITGRLMDRMNDWSGGKPFFVYVETCTQGTGLPFTADNFSSQIHTIVDYAKLKGYKLAGIIYFPQKVYPGWGSFDMTAPDVVARMILENAWLAKTFGLAPTPPAPVPPVLTLDELSRRISKLEVAEFERRLQSLEAFKAAVVKAGV